MQILLTVVRDTPNTVFSGINEQFCIQPCSSFPANADPHTGSAARDTLLRCGIQNTHRTTTQNNQTLPKKTLFPLCLA